MTLKKNNIKSFSHLSKYWVLCTAEFVSHWHYMGFCSGFLRLKFLVFRLRQQTSSEHLWTWMPATHSLQGRRDKYSENKLTTKWWMCVIKQSVFLLLLNKASLCSNHNRESDYGDLLQEIEPQTADTQSLLTCHEHAQETGSMKDTVKRLWLSFLCVCS